MSSLIKHAIIEPYTFPNCLYKEFRWIMELFLFIIIILVASTLQTSTGYGFSILATPFLLLLFAPFEAIQINLTLSLVISIALMAKISNVVDMKIVKRFTLGSIIGIPIGIIIFLYTNVNVLKIGISIIILVLTILLILRFRINQHSKKDIFVGAISGSLTTSIGMPGPPLLLYFSSTDTEKDKLRATTLAFYLFIYFLSLIIQVIFVGTNKTVWIYSGLALPVVFIGLFLGQILFKRMNQRFFQIFTYIILLFTGIYLLIDSTF